MRWLLEDALGVGNSWVRQYWWMLQGHIRILTKCALKIKNTPLLWPMGNAWSPYRIAIFKKILRQFEVRESPLASPGKRTRRGLHYYFFDVQELKDYPLLNWSLAFKSLRHLDFTVLNCEGKHEASNQTNPLWRGIWNWKWYMFNEMQILASNVSAIEP